MSQLVECMRSHLPIKWFCVKCFENDRMIDFTMCSQSLGAAPAQQGKRKSLACHPLHFISYYKRVCVPCLLIFIHCMSSCCRNVKDCFFTVFPHVSNGPVDACVKLWGAFTRSSRYWKKLLHWNLEFDMHISFLHFSSSYKIDIDRLCNFWKTKKIQYPCYKM